MIELIGDLCQEHKTNRSNENEPFKTTQAYKAQAGSPVGQWFYNQREKDFPGLSQPQQDRLGALLEWDEDSEDDKAGEEEG
eukprot:scaffold15108_cov180-Amphora_coffeaeformis.AAC.102